MDYAHPNFTLQQLERILDDSRPHGDKPQPLVYDLAAALFHERRAHHQTRRRLREAEDDLA
jgi:hypothetical protein